MEYYKLHFIFAKNKDFFKPGIDQYRKSKEKERADFPTNLLQLEANAENPPRILVLKGEIF